MIVLHKTFKFSGGKSPYAVTIIPSTGIKSDKLSATVTDVLDLKLTLTDINTTGTIRLSVVDSNGCTQEYIADILNPCQTSITAAIRFLPANTFVLDIADAHKYTYKWFASSGVIIVGNGQSATIAGVSPAINNTFTVYCTVIDQFGCEATINYNYTPCKPVFNDFNVQGQCIQDDVVINGTLYTANNYSYSNDINLSANTVNLCAGCNLDWSTLVATPTSNAVKVIYGTVGTTKTGTLQVITPQGNLQYPINYTVVDNCGNTYSGTFTFYSSSCIATSNCFSIQPLKPVQVKCSDIDLNATPKYSLTTGLLYTTPTGGKTPDWSTFRFIIPTNNGTPLNGYMLIGNSKMVTPLGDVIFNANGTITYNVNIVTSNPGADIIPWQVCADNGTCCSNTVLQTFVHACDPTPDTEDFTVCLNCGNTPLDVDLTSHIDLKGNTLTNIVISNLSNNSLSITPDVQNQKLVLSAGLLTGTITFDYEIQTSNNQTSNKSTVTVTINCAGTNQIITYC